MAKSKYPTACFTVSPPSELLSLTTQSISEMAFRFPIDRIAGLVLVLALHAAALYGLWSSRLIPSPMEAATVFVNFIALPATKMAEEPRLPPPPEHKPKPQSIEKAPPRRLVAETQVLAPTDYVAPAPVKSAPETAIQAPAQPLPSGPVALSSELSVTCTERSAPTYPSLSRRLRETGDVVLRVELSETGHVASAVVKSSSGYSRLDEAALAAVRTWRCAPAVRNGQAVRSVALQPFSFILQGH